MKKKWTKEKARELIDYYNNHSSEETSTEYQIASQSVRAIVSRLSKKYNIPIDRKIKWTEEKARELIEYYSSHTAKETAEKYQIANSHIHSAVNHFSKKYNISKDIKDTTKWTKEKARELIKYYNSHTTKETAEKYQMSIRSIMSIVNRLSKKYNIPWIKKKDGKIEWTEEKAREFIEYYSFHTAKETSMEYQLAIGTVSCTCHRLSKKYNIPWIKKKDGKIEWTEEKAREFIEYYNSHTAKETVEKYPMQESSLSNMYYYLYRKYNISNIKRRNRWTEEKARELIEYYSSHTAKETAEKYQIAIGTVSCTCHRLSKKYNIPIEKK